MNTQTPAAFHVDRYVKMRFLPMLFSHDYVRAEHNVFLYASRFLSGYDGCEWEFIVLNKGGGFMQPCAGEWRFVSPDNGADLALSAEAAGLVITALVLNHRSWMYDRHDEPELCEHYCQRFRQLLAYAETHYEAAAIFRALD
ncbi:antirestriction protein (plasmid) [Erwinia billingiae]|uniref:antirestriction protein n=1 Tax=Erwinia billingiae TaxID=182337 RepID=UPI0012476159|nr:antirestriction protein [Erwinia billingiae]QEW34552.1 antirestriction protein [Erwinia billingiae]